MTGRVRIVGLAVIVILVGVPAGLRAHCDTLTGPVVRAARAALQANDVTPVLKWLKPAEEDEARRAFDRVVAVRGINPAVRDVTDRWFFETIVRLHRLGEGEPYTGLKDGSDVDEAVERADRALETGAIDPVVTFVTDRIANGVRERFTRVRALQRHADDSVDDGRRYVEAYVDFVHYVETLGGSPPREAMHKSHDPACR